MDPQGTFAVLKTVFVSDYSRIHLLFKAWKAFSLLSRWPLFLLRLWNKSPTVHHHECIFFDFSESAALFWVAFSREKKVSFWLSFTFQISDAKSSWVAAHQKSITISSCLSAITSKASNRKISLEKIAQPFTPGKSRESRDRLALKLILMMREAPACFTKEKQKIKVPLSGR